MPSAEVCSMQTMTTGPTVVPPPVNEKNFNLGISSSDVVEGLVLEIKENLRLSAAGPSSLKAIPCRHLSRKSSRTSPYRLPGKYFCDSCSGTTTGAARHHHGRTKHQQDLREQDPYELLQALLRSENLINEAVRRVQMGFTDKKFYYESDEESSRSPVLLYEDH